MAFSPQDLWLVYTRHILQAWTSANKRPIGTRYSRTLWTSQRLPILPRRFAFPCDNSGPRALVAFAPRLVSF